jgi:D-alanyl-D-alanine carboxypeptidase
MRKILFCLLPAAWIFFIACSRSAPASEELKPMAQKIYSSSDETVEGTQDGGLSQPSPPEPQGEREAFIDDYWRWTFGDAGLPDDLARKVAAAAAQGPDFVMELLAILEGDPFLCVLVDKGHALPEGYAPDDLVELTEGVLRVTRRGLMLRRVAAASLEEMASAARDDGVTLTAGSGYRSAGYQAEVYAREVETYGQEAADRESAQPGYSQHQTGLVVDFTPIDDAFAETPASRWLLENAGRFGWSLSFPQGYEAATGYRWESWHYRYVGRELVSFIDKYFDSVQQYALQFISAWKENSEDD